MTDEELDQQKKITYYQTLLTAFTENAFEKDRSLLTLSSGAIGLLITLLSTIGVSSFPEIILYALTFISFGVCIVLLLHIFNMNKCFLINTNNNKEKIESNNLVVLDRLVFILFIVGLILFFTIGIISGVKQYHSKEKIVMSEESLKGLENMSSRKDSTKSLQGLDKLESPPSSPKTDQNNSGSKSSDNTPPNNNDTSQEKK